MWSLLFISILLTVVILFSITSCMCLPNEHWGNNQNRVKRQLTIDQSTGIVARQYSRFLMETVPAEGLDESVLLNQQPTPQPQDGDRCKCDLKIGCNDPNHTCMHVTAPVRLYDGSVIQPNSSDNEGYCFLYDTPTASSCDPKYGVPITTVLPSGRLQTACRCFWPTLFDQQDFYSDCSVVRACNGNGKLVHSETRSPLENMTPMTTSPVNIHDFECTACGASNCAKPGKDPDTGLPSCLPTPVNDRTDGLCLYEPLLLLSDERQPATTGTQTTASVLGINGTFISVEFAKSFSNSSLDKAYVPNPCAFDAFSGSPLGHDECRLTLSPSGIGYCESLKETVSTVIFHDDYLPNNGGRYSNACYKFAADNGLVDAYIAEYFVRPNTERVVETMAGALPPPLPVISVEIEAGKLDPRISEMLHLHSAVDPKRKILITQSAIPPDVETVPVPFDKTTMSRFTKEFNDFVHFIPTKSALLKYWVPVQKLKIPNCDNINEERETSGFPIHTIEANEYELKRQQHVVACREPDYDRRLAIVPNIDVNPLGAAYNANPTSAILRFDKSDFTVKPYWYRSYVRNKQEVNAYLSKLPSRPPQRVAQKKYNNKG